ENYDPEKATPPLNGDIVFHHVSFSYGGEKQVLHNLSLTVPAGKTVAILGATGSGKTSMMLLLQRLYEVDAGAITIGGIDIREMSKKHLRSRIGMVLQEPFLYSRTLQENIAITAPEAPREMIESAALAAKSHEFISGFEEGYSTIVGERGVTLSGGQKQRVAIARTLMKDNDILIFDDSLSAVDTETDAAIRATLKERRQGVTTFIISHRLTTLQEADIIFVFEKGQISTQGTHQELIQQEGLYQRIYSIQSAINLVADEMRA
ncbi:MAG: ATP-binding cassette domain-containing protein, partial [Symbiobacteriaceae bacterium]|nr:ATP-binding cassette domain-containing protein [Symbiobacteriaceae bacterium]